MKAYELLDSPDKWTKGTLARDEDGNEVMEFDAKAKCFCVMGALWRCYPDVSNRTKESRLVAAVRELGYVGGLADWNDAPERTFEEVRAALIKADV